MQAKKFSGLYLEWGNLASAEQRLAFEQAIVEGWATDEHQTLNGICATWSTYLSWGRKQNARLDLPTEANVGVLLQFLKMKKEGGPTAAQGAATT